MKQRTQEELKHMYVITGILKNGRRFKPFTTRTPQHYNIWNGTIWELIDGKRKLVKRIYN